VTLSRKTPLKPGTKGLARSSSPLPRRAPLKARTGIKAVSDGRKAENDGPWLETKRLVTERDAGRCQVTRFFPEHRCSFGRHPHHVTPRKHGGDRLAVGNVATVCWAGHDFIHNGIGWQAFRDAWEARESGWLRAKREP
jgi:hypothetical protein